MERLKKGFVDVDINNLIIADWNYKKRNEELQQKLKKNFTRNGQVENLIIRETSQQGIYEVVNGNHRLEVMQHLGIDKAHCFNLGNVSDAKAKRIAVETNETRFETDYLKLADLFNDIGKEFTVEDFIQTMPFSDEDITNLLAVDDFDWSKFDENEDAIEQDDDGTEWIKLRSVFDKRNIKQIPKDLGEYLGMMLDDIILKKQLTEKTKFKVLEFVYELYVKNLDEKAE